ncbi:hypothetical protein FIU28_17485 [Tardiphaga sp. vice154]|uniref:hypothetical protein n=1 Tax=Tardiphaga sp. vice154 TaxID=2592814 RepID=UPI0011649F3E|nr:hypothetical protein [Tardiphaga sp. vice154]QDM22745.1 hypothetical protein FIU28_17485 [Tardiphaga sp. vice154]
MSPKVIKNVIAEHQSLQAIDAGDNSIDIQIHRGGGEYEVIFCGLPGDIADPKAALQMVMSGIHEGVRRSTAPAPVLPCGPVFANDYTQAFRRKHVMFTLPRNSSLDEVNLGVRIFFMGHRYEKRIAAANVKGK